MNVLPIIAVVLLALTNIYQLIRYRDSIKIYHATLDDFVKPPTVAPVQKQIYDLFRKAIAENKAQEEVKYMDHDFTIIVTLNKETRK